MAKIIWTELALSNLEIIFEFIKQDSEKYAGLVVNEITKSVELLKTFPNFGRIVPELSDKQTREIIHSNYRIVYKIEDEVIQILTIHHCSKLFDPNSI